MKLVVESLEELFELKLGGFYPDGDAYIEVYKNPIAIATMGAWTRAITDLNGDFYIAAIESQIDNNYAFTHTDLIDWLKNHNVNIEMRWDRTLKRYNNGIAWQRNGNTNDFYLSESYENIGDEEEDDIDKRFDKSLYESSIGNDDIDYIERFMTITDVYTPRNVNFILEKITSA